MMVSIVLKMDAFVKYVVFVGVFTLVQAKLPDYLHICHTSQPNISECIFNSVNNLRDKLKTGIPELLVPSFEPLHLKDVQLKRGPQTAQIDSNVTQLVNYGISDFKLLELKANIPKNTFHFHVLFPHLYFAGKYKMNMQILFIKVQGEGPITGNMTNYQIRAVLKGNKIVKDDGKEYLQFEKMKMKVAVEKVHYHLGNLFNGDPVLGDATNAVLNENSELIFNEVKPSIESSVADSCTDMANKITLNFPYDELFPK